MFKSRAASVFAVALMVGFFVGQLWHWDIFPSDWYPGYFLQKTLSIKDQACLKDFPLTNKHLDCGEYEAKAANLGKLRSVLTDTVEQYKKDGKADRISVWVRDFTTQQWASIDETSRYVPASLLKVPLMIAYYKLAEISPSILTTPLQFVATSDTNAIVPGFPPSQSLETGKNYSVNELIERMIKYSDNNAATVLVSHIDETIFNQVLIDLGISIPSNPSDNGFDFVTAKSNASIFRILFNASYLNREYSQKVLALLSQTDFDGITHYLPKGITVAHKFGERGINNVDGSIMRELHDCGIVYKGDHPYSLCIMTEGKDAEQLLEVIQTISKIVYEQM